MIDDKYIDFFIGGNITEPVAMEIPLSGDGVHKFQEYLANYGLDIDTDGTHPEKISFTTRPDRLLNYSIITPVLDPKDLKPMYKVLANLLDEYLHDYGAVYRQNNTKLLHFGYPHVLDLSNLASQQQPKNSDTDFIEKLLIDAEETPDIMVFNKLNDLRQFHFQKNTLFCGAAMSDPYVVATEEYFRYLKFATSDVSYAVSYTGVLGAKQFNGFCNFLPNGQPIGFLHQYERRSDKQLFFHNTGIESDSSTTVDSSYTETMVNRFNNPVVATYVVWKKPHSDKIYMLKIPENNPQWEKLKEYYKTSFLEQDSVKRNKINAWIAEGDKHKTFVPAIDKNLSVQHLSDLITSKLDIKHKQEADAENKKKESIVVLKQLQEKYDAIVQQIQKIPYFGPCRNDGSFAYFDKYKIDAQNVIKQYESFINELSNLEQQMMPLVPILEKNTHIHSHIQTVRDAQQKIKSERIRNLEFFIQESEKLATEHVSTMCEQPHLILNERDMDFKYKDMIFDYVLNKTNNLLTDKNARVLASVIINLYSILSDTEKEKTKYKLLQIRNYAQKNLLKNIIKEAKNNKKYDIVKLFKVTLFEKITNVLNNKTKKQQFIQPDNTNTHNF